MSEIQIKWKKNPIFACYVITPFRFVTSPAICLFFFLSLYFFFHFHSFLFFSFPYIFFSLIFPVPNCSESSEVYHIETEIVEFVYEFELNSCPWNCSKLDDFNFYSTRRNPLLIERQWAGQRISIVRTWQPSNKSEIIEKS